MGPLPAARPGRPGRPAQRPRPQPQADPRSAPTAHPQVAPTRAARPGPHRRPRAAPGLHRASGAGPPPDEPACQLDRPTGRPIRRDEHLHRGDLGHLDTKKLGRIPPVVATESTAGLLGRATVAPTDQAAATTTCMPRSMTPPAWPRSRSWATSGPRPAPGSGGAPTTGSPCTASRWSGS